MSSLLRTYIREVLQTEGRVEDLQKKYPHINVKSIATKDPSGNNKYLAWMLKQLHDGNWDPRDVYDMVAFFHRNLSQFEDKDINSYDYLMDLQRAASDVSDTSKTQDKKLAKRRGATKVYEDGDSIVIRPETRYGVETYGRNTQWCITTPDSWEWYPPADPNGDRVFYYIISKTKKTYDPLAKIAIAIEKDTHTPDFWNAQDEWDGDEVAHEQVANFGAIVNACVQDSKKFALKESLEHCKLKTYICEVLSAFGDKEFGKDGVSGNLYPTGAATGDAGIRPQAHSNILDDEENDAEEMNQDVQQAACCLVMSQDGTILGVSRKDDLTAWGTPGGSVDPGETPEQAAARELEEETGLTAAKLHPVFSKRDAQGFVTTTFACEVEDGEINTPESGIIRWIHPSVLANDASSPFAAYNRELFKALGIEV